VLIAVVTVVVAVAAPFGSIALGLLSLLAVGLVLIKAMFRTRRWWPLTAVEGTIAVSGLVFVIGEYRRDRRRHGASRRGVAHHGWLAHGGPVARRVRGRQGCPGGETTPTRNCCNS
jgi:hypothetical protein